MSKYAPAIDAPNTVIFQDPVSLRSPDGGPSGLLFDIRLVFATPTVEHVQLPEQWRVTIRMYEYRLLDHNQRELLVYHWQPGSVFAGPDEPHLHVSAALSVQVDAITRRSIDLDKLHLVTSHVSLASVIRMLITEFGIAPRRSDWRETLDRTEALLSAEVTPRA